MYRGFWDLRSFSAAIILAVASLLLALPVFAQSAEEQRRYDEWKQGELTKGAGQKNEGPVPEEAIASGVKPRQVLIYANRDWQSTGVTVRQGEQYDIRAEGKWRVHPLCGMADASGQGQYGILCSPPFESLFAQFVTGTIRPTLIGKIGDSALIGKIGDSGAPFVVGIELRLTTDHDGPLFLRSNDGADLTNNSGFMAVTVTRLKAVAAVTPDQTRKELEEIRNQLEQLRQIAQTTPQSGTTPIVPANRPTIEGRNYALIIGNNEYANLPNLKTPIGDAAALSELLKLRYFFAPSNVKLLLNADRATIMDKLAGLRQRLTEYDRLLIYYAGHGQIDPVTEEGFWQPVDAQVGREYTWIANGDIRRQLRGLPAKHVLVMADSCFSGSLTRSTTSYKNIPKDRFFAEIDAHVSRKVISSGGTEPVADAGSGGHSVFAYYLLKALRENDQPFLTSFELFNRLARAVTNNSQQKPEYGTVADAGDEGSGDFTFMLR